MPMNNRLLVPQKLPLLLDYAPAAAAYSLRSLSNSYTGPVVTVRRSTDSAERDFTADEVSDGTLAAWCGGGDGFVKQWWSQTGSSHASQSNVNYQPRIVDAGVLKQAGGKPSLDFADSLLSDGWLSASLSMTDVNVFAVAGVTGFAASPTIAEFHSASYRQIINFDTLGKLRYYQQPTSYFSATTFSPATFQVSALQNGTSLLVNVYGAAEIQQTVSLPQATDTLAIGNDKTAGNPMHSVQELIVYPTDMTALRTRIEADMAWYY